jgi:ribose/xylose/arabinose/galactoside ABC-type transport system permease subunit
MNLLAAATTPAQSAPAYNPAYQQNQQYQNTTIQPDKPAPKASWLGKTLVFGNLIFNYVVIIFIVVLVFRFVWAFEKIAKSLEKGIVIRKDDTPTT